VVKVLYKNREKFASLSTKIGMIFSRLGLTPNQWTMLSLVPAIASFYFLTQSQLLLAAAAFAVAGFLDLVDGSVARVTGRVTKFGAYLDTVVDRYIEALIVLGLFFVSMPSFYLPANFWLLLYLFGGMMTTYVKAAAKEKELVREELKGGAFERAERLGLLFLGIFFGAFDLNYLALLIIVLAIATNISALQRILVARRS